MARTHTRCRTCRARQVLPKPPLEYVTPPHCKYCGRDEDRPSYGLLVADKWMQERNSGATLCGCDGYHFAYHRMGSLHCYNNADGSGRFGDIEDMPGLDLDL